MIPAILRQLKLPSAGVTLTDPEPGLDLTWAYAWPAGNRMCDDLADFANCQGQRILDLGCGRGHLGLSALVLGAGHVTFADGCEHALAHVAKVLATNALVGTTAIHRWGDGLPGEPFHLILGGDILYRASEFPALARTLAAVLRPDGAAYFGDPRHQIETEWTIALAEVGLESTQERRECGYSLVRILRSGHSSRNV